MRDTVNLLIGLTMGLNLLCLASGRIPFLIRLAALQGVILGVLPLLLEQELNWLLLGVSAATVAMKGVVIPGMLQRALRAASIDREVEPLLGFVPSLLLGAAATVGALALGARLPMLKEHSNLLLVPGAFATIVSGLILLVSRAKAITQVCGFLILENGIYLFGLVLLGSTPLLVEAGILLDLTVGVFVIGIVVDRIQRSFDTLDTRLLAELHE